MDFKKQVADWNNKYPIDRWYRKKYDLKFNSAEHRASNLLDIYFEFIEDKMYAEAQERFTKLDQKSERYKKQGWLAERELELSDSFFSEMDLSLFDDDKENTI